MAMRRSVGAAILFSVHLISTFAVILRTTSSSLWANEYESTELSCLIESISTNNPRIEWKKITNGKPSYVYFEKHISRDLENRAYLKEPATLVITNVTRSDTAQYRCEVTAHLDQRTFDEVLIDLVVRVRPVGPRCGVPRAVPVGRPADLRCSEGEGFPKSRYHWFRNREEIPLDPRSNPRFFNSSYTLNRETGKLSFRVVWKEDSGEYHCVAKNEAGHAECAAQTMEVYEVSLVGKVLGALLLVGALLVVTLGFCYAYKGGYFVQRSEARDNYKASESKDPVDCITPEDEAGFRHKSSFII
ncbi:LOW QUALITY PROTEIN: junctional adhesion molecule 3B-like [Brienomyrus brachyistius]|uniref:LOW QUALITY PROTEIN: junctional adhesion molecule 3B-like n=1 Tax=Brienomyrus brachyistius TaxID=42636 RepID=UPI0020B28B4A|nr:LOW QUALITY PROTEIN: junctional adhesion molecule 3B-like [Brienomyrus brachyistius]